MKRLILTLIIGLMSEMSFSQSFSDYRKYVEETGFQVRALKDTLGIRKDSTYLCQVIATESSYYFVFRDIRDTNPIPIYVACWKEGDPKIKMYFKRED